MQNAVDSLARFGLYIYFGPYISFVRLIFIFRRDTVMIKA